MGDDMAELVDAALRHGALGLIALIAVLALGYNTQQLSGLLKDKSPAVIKAGAPLIRMNIIVSAIAMVLFLLSGLYLASGERRARLDLDPKTTSETFKGLQLVRINGKPITQHPIMVDCRNQQATEVEVDFRSYLELQEKLAKKRANDAIAARAALQSPTGVAWEVDR